MRKGRPSFFKITKELFRDGRTQFNLKWDTKAFEGAACVGIDPSMFFPNQDVFTPSEEHLLKRVCMDCPVMEACLEWGLAHEKYGVWGGTIPLERQKIRRQLKWACIDPHNAINLLS